MAITDLNGCTWVGLDRLSTYYSGAAVTVNFISNSTNYVSFYSTRVSGSIRVQYMDGSDWTSAYNGTRWNNAAYKTVVFTSSCTDASFIAWLEANGTLTAPAPKLTAVYDGNNIIDGEDVVPPVSITYGGNTIATVNTGVTKTLACAGKLMTDNIGIGTKTLNCANKIMTDNVVVEVKNMI